ncbi:MAG: VacB/RNase II family 3'-5' exoribonuclease [Planctomycetota bacterium]
MPDRYRARLLSHVGHPSYVPADANRLVEDLRIEDPADFRAALDDMERTGAIDRDDMGRVLLPGFDPEGGEVDGIFRANPRGFGFVKPDTPFRQGDLFVPPDLTMGAMNRDRVRVVYEMERRFGGGRRGGAGIGGDDGPRFRAEVIEILARHRETYAGEMFRQGPLWLVAPDGKDMTDPIVVRDAESKNVRVGDKVVVDILEYPEGNALAEGVITRVLGEAGMPDVETQAVIEAFALPSREFPDACVDQARAITAEFDERVAAFEKDGPGAVPERVDLTGLFQDHPDNADNDHAAGELVCTIDPPDAKDYDDAIHIRRTDRGWDLGVHIADVGHFIEPKTALDEEAQKRGNSVYLPRLVIPMLPELLSNGICSLQEGVIRFARSAFMRYDRDGNIRGEGVAATIIKSKRRLTYLEAQALIDGDLEEAAKHCKTEPVYDDELISALREMDTLAKAIRRRRLTQGMISLDLKDVELVYDEEGKVVDAVEEDDAFTHTLIEMFMVEANEVAARLFQKMNVPLIRRVHPDPTPGDSEHVERAAKVAGYSIPSNPTREQIQGLLEATRGKPPARAVHMAILRTLTKAEYSPALIGHFALASNAYAHFTSPIRRYPDLTVHRAMKAYLKLTDNNRDRPNADDDKAWEKLGKELLDSGACPSEDDLRVIAGHSTSTEQNATDAERELRQFLVLQLLAEKLGEEFGGVVTGVTNRGVFVQLDKYLADGLIKIEDLPGDETRSDKPANYRYDRKIDALVDRNSGRSFAMGHMVRIRVIEVDLAKRTMELAIADGSSRAGGKSKLPKLDMGGALGGGMGSAQGAGFKDRTGAQKRSQRSKSRDKRKTDYRRDKKKR